MSDFTSRANLRLPGGGSTGTILPDEQVDIDVLNDNFRKIDALLGARNIPSASSYAGSMDGDLVYARDTEFLHMFSANAGGLITPRLPGSKMFSGTRAERTAFTGAHDGDMWRDSDNIGIIWVYKAGSPGTWEYSGNKCRGTKADILQTDTDGIAVPGMIAFCTDGNSDYVRRASAWRRNGLIASGDFTAQSTIIIDGMTDADSYELILHVSQSTPANDVNIRLRAGGATKTAALYYRQMLYGAAATAGASAATALASWPLFQANRNVKSASVRIFNLNKAGGTQVINSSYAHDSPANPQISSFGLYHSEAVACDGIELAASTGTITGYYEVRAL